MYFGWAQYDWKINDKSIQQIKSSFLSDLKDKINYKNFYDDQIDTLFTENLMAKKDFFGMVHYGVFKDDWLMFDKNNYLSNELPSTPLKLYYSLIPIESGYKLKIEFSPEDLVFLKKVKTEWLRLNIVFFDYDKSGLSIHSNSNQYEWGQSSTFKALQLNPPLEINIPAHWEIFQQNQDFYEGLFVKGEEKWKAIKSYSEQVMWWDRVGELFWDEIVLKVDTLIDKKDTLMIFNYGNQYNQVYIKNYNTWFSTLKDIPKIIDSSLIRMKKNKLGFIDISRFIQSPWGYGPCGACEHEALPLYLIENNRTNEILNIDLNEGNFQTYWPKDFNLADTIIPDFSSAKWNKTKNQLELRIGEIEEETNQTLIIGFDKNWNYLIEKIIID